MGKHYVPRYYLKGFTEAKSFDAIWVYEKGTPKVFTTNVSQIAHETNYYPDKVENYLANEIEAPANPIIDKIRNREMITPHEKAVLARYMIVMLKRVPRSRQRRREATPRVIKSYFDRLENQIEKYIKEEPTSAILPQRLIEVKRIRAEYAVNYPREIDDYLLPPETSPQVLAALEAMTWQFLVFDKAPVFLASDNPLFYFEGLGIGQQESEVTFPISSNIVLWATWHIDAPEGYFRTKDTIVHEINRRTASAATRYVYHALEDQGIVNLINRKKFRLNRIA